MLHDSPGILVLRFKRSLWIPTRPPPMGVPNAGEVSKNYVFQPVEKSLAQKHYRRKFMSICHGGLRPWWCTGGGIRGVINNSGGSRSQIITVTVHLTSTKLVVWKSVDDKHGIACLLCNSWAYCNNTCTKLCR